jgi:hypothetical protein
MSIRADVEDIQTTRSEKLLAVLLAAFLLLGGVWTYQKIDDVVRAHVSVPSFASAGPASLRLQEAQRRVAAATERRMRPSRHRPSSRARRASLRLLSKLSLRLNLRLRPSSDPYPRGSTRRTTASNVTPSSLDSAW